MNGTVGRAAWPSRGWRGLVLTSVLLALTGCVTARKYRLAKDNTPPAPLLGWNASVPSIDLTLQSVIVFHGPGSWKREALWDEYVVQLANHGDGPVTIDSVALIDLLGEPQFPGSDPWKLEKLSYTNWEKYGRTGVKLLVGAGVLVAYGVAVEAAALNSLLSGGAANGAVVFLNVVPVIALVDITVVAIMNHSNKEKVQAEFNRRRLVLPRTLPPGESVTGSLFFPMTPGPKRLMVKGRNQDTPVELTLELKPLAGLHLQPTPGK